MKKKKGAENEEISVQGFISLNNVPFESGVSVTADSKRRELRMGILQEAMR